LTNFAMKCVILIDNTPHHERDLFSEHGLSIYIEADGLRWLVDVGASGQFLDNARVLGVPVEDVDFLILSHGHSDHTEGLSSFLQANNKAKVVMSPYILSHEFFSYRLTARRNISIHHAVVEAHPERFLLPGKSQNLSEHVAVICEIEQIYPTPKANRKLYVARRNDPDSEQPDAFRHETAVAIHTPKGLFVFSGCCHNGILNVLQDCTRYFNDNRVIACIGGTHLVDSDPTNCYESDQELRTLGAELLSKYPGMQLITSHCTGILARRQLALSMGDALQSFHTGYCFTG